MKLTTKERKKFKIRNKLKKFSSSERFRLSIFRSSKNISAQIIDDRKSVTLLSVSSSEKNIKSLKKTNKVELSKIVAESKISLGFEDLKNQVGIFNHRNQIG